MGLINWIFDIYQHSQIDRARTEAAAARAELSSFRSGGSGVDAGRLQAALEELALATKALQRVIVDKGLCSADELRSAVRAIDREDGVEDGRARL